MLLLLQNDFELNFFLTTILLLLLFQDDYELNFFPNYNSAVVVAG